MTATVRACLAAGVASAPAGDAPASKDRTKRGRQAQRGLCSHLCSGCARKQCSEHPEELRSWQGAEWVPKGPPAASRGLGTVGPGVSSLRAPPPRARV